MEDNFEKYRVLREVRITLTDNKSHTLQIGSTVEFDGGQVKLGGAIHSNPAFAGAIKQGWVVPASSSIMHHDAQPANITMHQAAPRGPERAVVNGNRHVVTEEDRDVGSISQVRSAAKVGGRKSFNPGGVVVENEGAVVIGKMRNPPRQENVEVSVENATRIAQYTRNLDGTQFKAVVDPVRKEGSHLPPTGAVPFNTAGDFNRHAGGGPRPVQRPVNFSEAPAPAPEYQDPRVQALLASIAQEKELEAQAQAQELEMQQFREFQKEQEAKRLREEQGAQQSKPPSQPQEDEEEDLPADLAQRVQMIRAVIPNFEWDMTRPWKTRVADAVKQYGNKKVYLQAILSVETDAVKNHVQRLLKEGKGS